ncbi:Uncharacterised protein [Mycobacteroides abscessus subsp. abscessus]|uniref:TPR repeat region-containing protein n=1 Tax=Mycobacteroides abscessus TaxID=36809 RepID=UPI00092A8CA5|nr:hypothetical protein [Mycobacteroides abscessus]SIL71278.1 Uncharacterised protein [Mycobacteroides abscessus subsp. abscessus]
MTGLSLRQGQKFPELIHQFGQAAQKRAMHTGNAADEAAAIKNASTWEGEGGEAAREALGRHITTFDASKVKDNELAITAWAAELRAIEVAKHIREAIQFAESGHYPCHVDEDTNTVSPPKYSDTWGKEERAAADKHYVDSQNGILQVVAELEEANMEFANAIKAGTGGEIPPGVKEGSEDAQAVKKALAEGKPPPAEVLDRIKQITHLSDEQKKAWEAGKLTIPQSSMDYLNSFSRSMDGQNIQQLKDMMLNKVSEPDARNMMNGFQMIGDPKVQAPGKDGMPRMQGSFDRLPDGIKNVAANTPKLDSHANAVQFQDQLADRKDLAAIMAKGSSDFMHGSPLDHAVLKQASELLDKMPEKTWSSGDGAVAGPIKDSREAIQSMLSAAGRDNIAAHDLVAGVDGSKPNDKFIGELLKQDWNDNGAGAGALAHGVNDVANDPTQAGAAQRAGETIHAFDQYIGNHAKELSELPFHNTDKVFLPDEKATFAELNPELAKELGQANEHFTDDMVGKNLDNTRGFSPLDTMQNGQPLDQNMPHTRDVMGTLEGNSDAAKALHGSVDQNVLAYQDKYAHSISEGPRPDVQSLVAGGRLQGLDDVGSAMAHAQDGRIDYKNAMDAYQSKVDAFDLLKKAGGEIPQVKDVLDNIGRMPGGDNMLKDMLLGKPPEQFIDSHIPVKDTNAIQYHIAQQLFEQGYGNRSVFPDGFPSYGDSSGETMNRIREYLGTGISENIDKWGDAYRDALPHTPNQFGR